METNECDCLQSIGDKIKDHIFERKTNPQGFEIIEADWEYKSWYPRVRLYINYVVKSSFKKKDGTASKPKNEHVRMFFNYCPFCGKKYGTDEKTK